MQYIASYLREMKIACKFCSGRVTFFNPRLTLLPLSIFKFIV